MHLDKTPSSESRTMQRWTRLQIWVTFHCYKPKECYANINCRSFNLTSSVSLKKGFSVAIYTALNVRRKAVSGRASINSVLQWKISIGVSFRLRIQVGFDVHRLGSWFTDNGSFVQTNDFEHKISTIKFRNTILQWTGGIIYPHGDTVISKFSLNSSDKLIAFLSLYCTKGQICCWFHLLRKLFPAEVSCFIGIVMLSLAVASQREPLHFTFISGKALTELLCQFRVIGSS